MCILHLDALVCQGGCPMAQQSSVDKFFDAVDNAYDVVLDTLKAGVDRGYRVSKSLIEQPQPGQHEALEAAQSVAKSPTNVANATGAVVQTLTKTQGRVLEISRQWLDEALDSHTEGPGEAAPRGKGSHDRAARPRPKRQRPNKPRYAV